jgi:hypothetical protein
VSIPEGTDTILAGKFSGTTESFKANTGIVYSIRPRQVSSRSFPIQHSTVIQLTTRHSELSPENTNKS